MSILDKFFRPNRREAQTLSIADRMRVGGLVKKVRQSLLVKNIMALYGLQFVNYLLPVLTIPYLARVLGPSSWGTLAVAQSLGGLVILVVEFGFSLSATREVARFKDDHDRAAQLVGGVMGAKGFLAAVAVAGAVIAHWFIPALRDKPAMFWAAVAWAVAQSFNMGWFFQGREQMRVMATLDISAKAVATASLFLFVRLPGDAWVALVLQAIASFVSTGIAIVLANADVPLRFPTIDRVREAILMGAGMFLFRSSVSLYTTGNALLLGFFASPEMVGYYVGAEKLVKVAVGLMGPVTQALYPRLSYLAKRAHREAARLARVSGLIILGSATITGAALWIMAPWVVRFVLGSGYAATVPVLRILVFILPCNAVSNALGIQWLLPMGRDRQFNLVTVAAGGLNIGLALILGPRFGHIGMATAVTMAELWVAIGTLLAAWGSQIGLPWSDRTGYR